MDNYCINEQQIYLKMIAEIYNLTTKVKNNML